MRLSILTLTLLAACSAEVVDLGDAGPPDAASIDAGSMDGGASPRAECDRVEGTPALALSRDEGVSTTALVPVPRITYTRAITVTPTGLIWAMVHGSLLVSTDGGCHFEHVRSTRGDELVVAPDGTVFLFDDDGGLNHTRIHGRAVEVISATSPGLSDNDRFVARSFDRSDLRRMRAVSSDGRVFTSVDGGRTYTVTAEIDQPDGVEPDGVLDATISREDLDEIVVSVRRGAERTTDGGRSWQRSNAPGAVIDLERSPIDSRLIWAHGAAAERELWVSSDGGQSFQFAIGSSGFEAELGPGWFAMAPSPHDRDVIFLGDGDGLHRFDLATGERRSSVRGQRVGSIGFDPRSADFLVIGLENLDGL